MPTNIELSKKSLLENLKVITIDIPYLYHTVQVNDEASAEHYKDMHEENPNYVVPKINKFPTDLKNPKFFTVSDKASYGSELRDIKWAFLKYTVKGSLRLLDIRKCNSKTIQYIHHDAYKNNDFIKKYKADGYIGYEDYVEVCIICPDKHIESEYQVLEYIPIDSLSGREFTDAVNKQSEKNILKWINEKSSRTIFPNNLTYSKMQIYDNIDDHNI
jgi:hypothetical protein